MAHPRPDLLPVVIVSGAFGTVPSQPRWLSTLADYLPVRPMVSAAGYALRHPGGPVVSARDLAVLAIWAALALVGATVAFRWEPTRPARRHSPSTPSDAPPASSPLRINVTLMWLERLNVTFKRNEEGAPDCARRTAGRAGTVAGRRLSPFSLAVGDRIGDRDGMDVDEVADELYGLPPAEFTAARDRRAAQARTDGDRDTARAIAAMRRPSTSAWLVNLLVRDDRTEARSFVELGRSLRQAQQELAGDEMRALSQQRRKLVIGLTGRARRLGGTAGQQVSADVSRQVEETLSAVLADDEAAALFTSGRLTTALRHSGLGPTVGAGPTPVREPPPRRDEGSGQGAAKVRARELAQARADLQNAQKHVGTSAETAAESRREVDDLQRRQTELSTRIDELTAALSDAKAEIPRLQGRMKQARRAADSAERAARDAGRREADARSRLERLDPGNDT